MKNRDPLCEAAEGVAEPQQCLGATQQVLAPQQVLGATQQVLGDIQQVQKGRKMA